MTSVYIYLFDVLVQGYPFLECICSLLPVADEVVIVDCGSTDGTKELAHSLAGPKVKVYDEEPWVNGHGGRNHRKTGSRCHELCSHDTIIFVEADEVWSPSLVDALKVALATGRRNMKFWRYQVTQNYQRVFWYPEPKQHVWRVFPKGSSIMRDDGTDIFIQESADAKEAILISNEFGYIVDCRNNHRDQYLRRENIAKDVWAEHGRKTTRMAPAHAAYSWEISLEDLQKELQDERWTWKHTIIDIPPILRPQLGQTSYQIRPELVDQIKNWR